MTRRRLILGAILLATVLLAVHPVRALLASHYYEAGSRLLDDTATGEQNVVDISAENMPRYRDAIRSIQRARFLAPDRTICNRTLADLYLRLGNWASVMDSLGEPLPAEAPTKSESYDRALFQLTAAVARDPADPDLHFQLARAYRADDQPLKAKQELGTAILAAPYNSALRYSVASQYLLWHDNTQALVHAKALASMDDSYHLPDYPVYRIMREQRTQAYLARLSNSYLFRALEIAWRASGRDMETVRSMVPKDEEAQEVWNLFQEWKGVDLTVPNNN
jgi:tetratricopeptide (TPR) repeat protein